MSDSVSSTDELSIDMVNEGLLIDVEELDEEMSNHLTSSPIDSRRRLERCIEDRQLEKDLREFDFDI